MDNSAIRRGSWGGRKSDRQAWLRSAGKIAPRWAIRCLGADLQWFGSRKKTRLRYEDFCAEPAKHAGRILRRAGLRPALERGQRTFDLPADHFFLGNRSRHGSGPTTIELDEAWRASIPRPARLATLAMTWPLLLLDGDLWRRPRVRTRT